MKVKFLKTALLGFVISVSSLVNVANAGLINIGALTSNDDGSTTVISDTLNSLEWLRWDQLADLTYAETLAQISSGAYSGWNIAGVNEANLFLDALYNGAAHGCSNNTTSNLTCLSNGSFSSADYTTLLGDSWTRGTASRDVAWFYDDTITDNSAGYLFLTSGVSNSKWNTHGTIASTDSWAHSNNSIGWLMYRSTSEVPEPSTLAIFALGMMGLASRRFKKQS